MGTGSRDGQQRPVPPPARYQLFLFFPQTPTFLWQILACSLSVGLSVLFRLFTYFVFLDSTCKWNHVIICFCVWHISLSIIPSRFHPCCPKWQNSILFYCWIIVHYNIYTTFSLSTHLSMDIPVANVSWLLLVMLQMNMGCIYHFQLEFWFALNT